MIFCWIETYFNRLRRNTANEGNGLRCASVCSGSKNNHRRHSQTCRVCGFLDYFTAGVGGNRVYLLFTVLAAVLSATAVTVLLHRLCPDAVRRLSHRQKPARMVLENQWYE